MTEHKRPKSILTKEESIDLLESIESQRGRKMTEPKYKVGQWVELHTDAMVKIEKLQGCADGQAYWCNDLESFHAEEEIKQPVKIYRDYGKVFCKDCKHYDDTWDEPKFTCTISAWLHEWADCEVYEYRKNLKPPPKCNCFEPKESK